MRTFGNILWHFPFLGFITAALTWLLGLLLFITVIGAPIGRGLMELAKFYFVPFGKEMVHETSLGIASERITWRALSLIAACIYLPIGLLLGLLSIIQVGLLFVTIIGIPAGLVIAKSLRTWVNPVGMKCVGSAVASELERRRATQEVQRQLG